MSEEVTVFVIDDDASLRKSPTRLLRSMGFGVETFASAEDYLDRETYRGLGRIVLDPRMPGLSGIDLQDRLNNSENALPIVFITGHGTVPASVKALKAGAEDQIPISFLFQLP